MVKQLFHISLFKRYALHQVESVSAGPLGQRYRGLTVCDGQEIKIFYQEMIYLYNELVTLQHCCFFFAYLPIDFSSNK